MTLSKTQQQVMEKAKREIDEARTYETYEEYFLATNHCNNDYNTPDKYKEKDLNGWEGSKAYWHWVREAKVLTHCNSKTLEKLEKLGLIEILKLTTGEHYGIDLIKVLNY